eukprot:Rmarinus@m.20087
MQHAIQQEIANDLSDMDCSKNNVFSLEEVWGSAELDEGSHFTETSRHRPSASGRGGSVPSVFGSSRSVPAGPVLRFVPPPPPPRLSAASEALQLLDDDDDENRQLFEEDFG